MLLICGETWRVNGVFAGGDFKTFSLGRASEVARGMERTQTYHEVEEAAFRLGWMR